jgi:hypothetical protein
MTEGFDSMNLAAAAGLAPGTVGSAIVRPDRKIEVNFNVTTAADKTMQLATFVIEQSVDKPEVDRQTPHLLEQKPESSIPVPTPVAGGEVTAEEALRAIYVRLRDVFAGEKAPTENETTPALYQLFTSFNREWRHLRGGDEQVKSG